MHEVGCAEFSFFDYEVQQRHLFDVYQRHLDLIATDIELMLMQRLDVAVAIVIPEQILGSSCNCQVGMIVILASTYANPAVECLYL